MRVLNAIAGVFRPTALFAFRQYPASLQLLGNIALKPLSFLPQLLFPFTRRAQHHGVQSGKSAALATSKALGERSKTVALIRHGESEYNRYRKDAFLRLRIAQMFVVDPGLRDSRLTPAGLQQTQRALEVLVSHTLYVPRGSQPSLSILGLLVQPVASLDAQTHHPPFDLILVSPLSRAIDTALRVFCLDPSSRGPTAPKIHIVPLLTEWLDTESDMGHSLPILKEKYKAFADTLDWTLWKETEAFEGSRDVWWYSGDAKEMTWFQKLYRHIRQEPKCSVLRRIEALNRFLDSRPESRICLVGHSWFFRLLTGESKMRNCEVRFYTLTKEAESGKTTSNDASFYWKPEWKESGFFFGLH